MFTVNWRAVSLIAVSLIVVVLALFPFFLSGVSGEWPLTAKTIEKWQAWYGVLVGFGGLAVLTRAQFSFSQREAERQSDKEALALAIALKWEIDHIGNRVRDIAILARGSQSLSPTTGTSAFSGDLLSGITGERVLGWFRLFPEPVVFSRSAEKTGLLGEDLGPAVAAFYMQMESIKSTVHRDFGPMPSQQITFIHLDAVIGSIEDIVEYGNQCVTDLDAYITDPNKRQHSG